MALRDYFWKAINQKPNTEATKPTKVRPVNMAGTTPVTLNRSIHKSDSLTEQNADGLMGNDYTYPIHNDWVVSESNGARLQDIANSHLSEGPAPGRIPYAYSNKWMAKLGRGIEGNPGGDVGFLLNISGERAGGLGDAQFIPHVSIQRPAGMARAAYRTIDDGAMIPGVFVADATRR